MKVITWKNAFFNPNMRKIRELNNIMLPDEYIQSTNRVRMAFGIWYLISGFVLGYMVSALLEAI